MSVHFACTLGLSTGLLLCLPGTLDAAEFRTMVKRLGDFFSGRAGAMKLIAKGAINTGE
jgi:hypothetical protein